MAGQLIEIPEPEDSGAKAPELRTLLDVIGKSGTNLVWAILEFEGTFVATDNRVGPNFHELSTAIASSPIGARFIWTELVTLSRRVSQIINGMLVGARSAAELPLRNAAFRDIMDRSVIAIEVFDSSTWRFWARDEALTARILELYPAATVVDPTSST